MSALGLKAVGTVNRLPTIGAKRDISKLIARCAYDSVKRVPLLATVFGSSQNSTVVASRRRLSEQTKHRIYAIDPITDKLSTAVQTGRVVRSCSIELLVTSTLPDVSRFYSYNSSVHDLTPSIVAFDIGSNTLKRR